MALSKEEVLAAIREVGAELGRQPTLADMKRNRGLPRYVVEQHFGGFALALQAAGYKPRGRGHPTSLGRLFEDWASSRATGVERRQFGSFQRAEDQRCVG